MKWAKKQTGFTIVELLIVVVVIAILAAITIVAYNGIQKQAQDSRRDSDIAQYYKAILMARNNSGKVLREITNHTYSVGYCFNSANPDGLEPRDLPKDHQCWTNYYLNLERIGAAAGMNLNGLRSGDPRGNPYGLDENEGENCSDDTLSFFTGNGTQRTTRAIPRTASC